jgi:Uma2 family endonuclease
MAFDSPIRTSGEMIATNVAYEHFLNGFEGMRVEWVNGHVILMAGVDEKHDALTRLLDNLLEAYLEAAGGGRVVQEPVLMRFLAYSRTPDHDGYYRSRVLPRLRLKVELLWRDELPGVREVVALVDEMLKG